MKLVRIASMLEIRLSMQIMQQAMKINIKYCVHICKVIVTARTPGNSLLAKYYFQTNTVYQASIIFGIIRGVD